MNQYEALYIIVPTQDEEAMKASVEKFKGIVATNGGEVTAVDEWGKKRLHTRSTTRPKATTS